jgi:hypothetical protein
MDENSFVPVVIDVLTKSAWILMPFWVPGLLLWSCWK